MAWDFSTDPEFPAKARLDHRVRAHRGRAARLAFSSHLVYDKDHPVHEKVVRPLQGEVRARDLWACHLGPELGGKGYGQLKLALMNEIIERALSRETQGVVLAKKQVVQDAITESWIQLLQFRLQVLQAAWTIDQVDLCPPTCTSTVRSACRTRCRRRHVAGGADHGHRRWADRGAQVTIARQLLKRYQPYEGLFPPAHLPERRAEARPKFAHLLDLEVGDL